VVNMVEILICPDCGSGVVKDAHDKSGNQRYKCKNKDCRHSTIYPKERPETPAERTSRHLAELNAEERERQEQERIEEERIAEEARIEEERIEEERLELERIESEKPVPTIADAMVAVQSVAQTVLQQGQQLADYMEDRDNYAIESAKNAEKLLNPTKQTGGLHPDGIYFSNGQRVSGTFWHFCRCYHPELYSKEQYLQEQADYRDAIRRETPFCMFTDGEESKPVNDCDMSPIDVKIPGKSVLDKVKIMFGKGR